MSAPLIQRFLMRAAFSASHVFAWVGMFAFLAAQKESIAEGLAAIALLYALQHVIVILFTPYVARHLGHGMRNHMTLGVLAASAAFAALGIGYYAGSEALTPAITIFAILLGVYRALYFTPYSIIAHAGKRVAYVEIFILLLPAAIGFLLMLGVLTPALLFIGASIVLAVSMLPIYWIEDQHEGFAWGYRESFHQLFDLRHRTLLIASLCDGIEAAALLLVWPIVIWLVLGGSMALLGLMMSVTLLLALLIHALFRRFSFSPSATHEVLIRMSVWVLRSIAGTAGAIVLIDTYGSSSSTHSRGIDRVSLEQAADNHTYVDEYTALKEMGNGLGRVLACLMIGIFAPLLTIGTTTTGVFVIVAAVSALSVYVARQHARTAF